MGALKSATDSDIRPERENSAQARQRWCIGLGLPGPTVVSLAVGAVPKQQQQSSKLRQAFIAFIALYSLLRQIHAPTVSS